MNLREDFLAAGPVLIARLKAELPPTVFVLSAKDLAGVKEAAQQAPAVHVVYQTHAPKQGAGGAWNGIEQTWLTVAVVRNVSSLAGAEAPMSEAGPLMAGVVNALQLWVPTGHADFQGIHLKPAPPAGFTRAGFAYFPIAWGVDLRIRRGR